jgi:tetratricopeptide (TPR) repeat protein
MDTFLGPWDSSGRSETYAETAEFWEQFNHTLIVVYPAAEETAVFELLPPSFDNPVTMWQRAAQLAEQSLRSNPNNPFAWFNLGSSLTQLAELTHDEALFQTAVGAFDQARQIGLPWRMLWYQFGPYRAYLAAGRAGEVLELTNVMLQGGGFFVEETHLYRGLALAALGQEWASQDAYRQARVINPNSLLFSSLAATPVGVPAR